MRHSYEAMNKTPELMVDLMLAHRKRGFDYQWLTLMRGEPQHEATWKPNKDLIDAIGTMTAALQIDIESKGISSDKLMQM